MFAQTGNSCGNLVIRHFEIRPTLFECTRSPVFSHLSSSLQGLWTIRAFGAEERFQKAFNAQQDLHSEAWFLLLTTSRWFAVRLHGICSIFVTVTTFGCLLLRDRAAEVRGGGAARAVGDGSGRVGLHLQRGPEAAGVSGQCHPEEEPHPGHPRGHGQRGPQFVFKASCCSCWSCCSKRAVKARQMS
ncbi:uncharacterized protein LOC119483570 isoform X1 [Sebastes umbrosus]|uniref:uncharacterized protein LOC119483570 isoform X1 n=1 Tax=Sebastes umbrosus TaxID=72105 RepID=UPI00189DF07A|nr:uncharacterized protein LOC119483570 isoform X1 [Sebastes umbrosus]